MARTRKYYLKNNYLTLRSNIKVQRRSLRYATHALWLCTHIPNIIDLSRKKQLFDLEVKGQGATQVITVCDTPPYFHAPTYQISLTYLERQTCYGPDKKILFKKQLFDLQVKGQGHTKVITVRYTPPYVHTPIYQISLTYLERQKCYGPDKKILFKKQLFDLEVKYQGPTKVTAVCDTRLMVMHPHTKYH